MSQRELAIPKGSTVLVTGANGYVASHIVDILIQLGYEVRGTVRSVKPWLNQLFEERHGKGKFQSVVVPNLEAADAYDEAIKGVSGFLHVVRWVP
jgi:nucleoside-diphosphate-sugar epimerase